MSYTPPQHILENYAKVLVRFALNQGKGLKKGETVYLAGNEITKPLFLEVRKEIYRAGGHVIANYTPDNWDRYQFDRDTYDLAKPHQLDWFPEKYLKGLIDEIDHFCYLIADADPHALDGVDGKKIMRKGLPYQ